MSSPHSGSVEGAGPIANDSVLYAALRGLHIWQYVLVPALSAVVDKMIQTGDLPINTADALDDLGQLFQRLGSEIIHERNRRGLPMPDGPDD